MSKASIKWLFLVIRNSIIAACSPKLEIRDDLPESAFACMQHYEHASEQDNPLIRKTGEMASISSFHTINDGISAVDWRLALIDSANDRLDIQSLVWKTDETGSLMVLRVLKAAERGIQVRIQIDDLDSANWNKRAAILTQHPNIEIKVFNPFKKHRGNWAGRGFELVTDLERLNHRLHNKLMLADKKVAIVGGRNIGNEYFGNGKKLDFRDYDVIATGPVVEELAESFDVFWEGAWSYRISDLPKGEGNPDKINELRKDLEDMVTASNWLNQAYQVEHSEWSDRITEAKNQLYRAPARAVFDCPPPEGHQFPVQTVLTLNKIADQAQNEILMISPYVVPLNGFHEAIKRTVGRGVTVRLLTNSLASADHTIAFSGYKKHRQELLQNGVIIRELKPDGEMWELHKLAVSKAKHVALHAKVYIFDRRWVYVGSLNLDPRAVHWNTELGVLIGSPELAQQIYIDFSVDLSPQNSWQVELRIPEGKTKPRLVWEDGDEEITKEPSKGFIQRLNLWFFSLFPIDEQL